MKSMKVMVLAHWGCASCHLPSLWPEAFPRNLTSQAPALTWSSAACSAFPKQLIVLASSAPLEMTSFSANKTAAPARWLRQGREGAEWDSGQARLRLTHGFGPVEEVLHSTAWVKQGVWCFALPGSLGQPACCPVFLLEGEGKEMCPVSGGEGALLPGSLCCSL